MKVTSIVSPHNALLKRVRSLHQRKGRQTSGHFLIEGTRGVDEAFKKRLNVADVLVSETFWRDEAGFFSGRQVEQISVVEDRLFKELCGTSTPAGIIATAAIPQYDLDALFSGKPLVVIVHAVQDPGNLGTIFRTALAASATGIILTKGTADPFNPKVVRAAMGALFAMPVLTELSLAEAVSLVHSHKLRVIGCEPEAKQSLFTADLSGALAIVLGNEGQGFSADELQLMDEQVAIPMNPESESLNVAMCGAVVLFNVVRERLRCN